jgi:hypothetical protein
MPVSLDDALTVAEDTVFRELEGESVLLNLESGMYFGLDAVGTRVWRLFEETRSLRAVRDRLTEEYDVDPATAERDLLELADALVQKGLWAAHGGPGGDRQS